MLAIIQKSIPRDILSKCSLKAQKDAIELLYATSKVIDNIPKYEDKINLENGVYCVSNPQFMDFIKQTFKKESMIVHIQEVFGYLISDCPPLKEFLLFYASEQYIKIGFSSDYKRYYRQ